MEGEAGSVEFKKAKFGADLAGVRQDGRPTRLSGVFTTGKKSFATVHLVHVTAELHRVGAPINNKRQSQTKVRWLGNQAPQAG